jgi:hypothetical protein
VLHHVAGAVQAADLANAGDVLSIPLHAELEVLVRVEALRVHGELGHLALYLHLSGDLLDLDYDDLSRLERASPTTLFSLLLAT